MIVCWRTVRIPRAERERFGAWVQANRTVRQQHGILFELVLDRSARQNPAKAPQLLPPPDHHGNDTDGVLEAVVVTAWASHDAFDAWINTPDRDRLTASRSTRPSPSGRSPATTPPAATSTATACVPSPAPSTPSPTSVRSSHELGHPCASQDRPDRLPVADAPVHRPPSRDPVRPRRPGPRRRRAGAWALVRRARRRVHPPGQPLHVRGADRRLRPGRRPGPGAAGTDRARRRHRQRSRQRPARPWAASDRRGRPSGGGRRPAAAGARQLRLRRPVRLVPDPPNLTTPTPTTRS